MTDTQQTPQPNAPPPPKLPKLRKGLTFAFSDYDIEGKPQWLIHDSGRNKFFIIGLLEYELLERWSLCNPYAIIEAVNKETTLEVDMNDIENLLRFLAHNYLIQQSGYEIYKQAKEQKIYKNDSWISWLISYYLFFRVPLCHPDAFLTRTKQIGEFVFGKFIAYTMAILGIVALYQLSMQWEQFTHTFPSIFTWHGLMFSMIAYMICKACHELGHAYMCKQYGVPVPSLGIAFLVFWPVLYTDTTLSWSLSSAQRMRIALAGIWVETYVTIIAALIWCNVHNLTVQSICYVTITVNWIASLLINVSPFMRFDGYYVLADFLKMPNLQPRAFALTRWQIRKWLFHWDDEPPERFHRKLHNFLVAYSIITWLYRLTVYLGIALLVYHFFIKIIGILLLGIELFYFILGPIVTEIQTWFHYKEKFSLNRRTQTTLFLSFMALILFFLPINENVRLPGTLSYAHAFLVAPEESILQTTLPPLGSKVKANQAIVQLYSPQLNHELNQAKLEYEKKIDELRRASINKDYANQKSILLSDINRQRAKYSKLMDTYKKLTLSVAFDGIVVDTASELHPGAVVMKDEWLADIIQPNVIQGEAFVSQIDVNQLRAGLKGHFYSNDLDDPVVPVKIISIEALNTSKLNCHYSTEIKQDKKDNAVVETSCYNVSDLGGEIPTFLTPEGDYVPVNSVFRVIFTTQKPTKIGHLQRGELLIETTPSSYAGRVFYKIKTLLIQQSGF